MQVRESEGAGISRLRTCSVVTPSKHRYLDENCGAADLPRVDRTDIFKKPGVAAKLVDTSVAASIRVLLGFWRQLCDARAKFGQAFVEAIGNQLRRLVLGFSHRVTDLSEIG